MSAHILQDIPFVIPVDLKCVRCEEPFDPEMDIHTHGTGYWCECDRFNHFDPKMNNEKFLLLLESKDKVNVAIPRANIHFNKRLSPLRYPGGKIILVEFLYHELNAKKTDVLISPFAGGAGVELALLDAKVVKRLILNDLDFGVYSLFQIILSHPDDLIYRIQHSSLTHEDFFNSREIVKDGLKDCDLLDAAWNTLVVNRLAFSGIFNANPLGGSKGSLENLLARWNPSGLCKRIQSVHDMRERISIYNMDACQFIEDTYWHNNATQFIDPPYFKKGPKLYRCFYTKENHEDLAFLLESLVNEFPGTDVILCYDDEEFIENLYPSANIRKLKRAFSI